MGENELANVAPTGYSLSTYYYKGVGPRGTVPQDSPRSEGFMKQIHCNLVMFIVRQIVVASTLNSRTTSGIHSGATVTLNTTNNSKKTLQGRVQEQSAEM